MVHFAREWYPLPVDSCCDAALNAPRPALLIVRSASRVTAESCVFNFARAVVFEEAREAIIGLRAIVRSEGVRTSFPC